MAEELYEEHEPVGTWIRRASDHTGTDFAEIMFEGPKDRLEESKNAQVAVFVHSMAVTSLLEEEGFRPDAVAGHSLGEFTALAVAGALSPDDTLKLLRKRGEYMSEAGHENPGKMSAITGLNRETVREFCADSSLSDSVVRVANHNTETQVVVAGEPKGVRQVENLARKEGAGRVVPLPVSGAFHTPLMDSAQEQFLEVIDEVTIEDPDVPVMSNRNADYLTDADAIRTELEEHMLSSVEWYRSMQTLFDDDIETFVEVGPGKVLKGMILRIDRSKEILSTFDPRELDHTVEILSESQE